MLVVCQWSKTFKIQWFLQARAQKHGKYGGVCMQAFKTIEKLSFLDPGVWDPRVWDPRIWDPRVSG